MWEACARERNRSCDGNEKLDERVLVFGLLCMGARIIISVVCDLGCVCVLGIIRCFWV